MTEFHEDSDVTYGHVRKPRFENKLDGQVLPKNGNQF